MARKRKTSDQSPTAATPPRIVLAEGAAPEPTKAPTAAERMAGYARAYPERIPVLKPGDAVLVLHPLGFYVQHSYDAVVAVQRRALRDESKAVIRAAMSAAVPANWSLPEATRFETDGARGLAPAPESPAPDQSPEAFLDVE